VKVTKRLPKEILVKKHLVKKTPATARKNLAKKTLLEISSVSNVDFAPRHPQTPINPDIERPSWNVPNPIETSHTHNTKPLSFMELSPSPSVMESSSDPPFSFEDYTVLGDEVDVKIFTICLEEYLDEMDDDHEALTETWLAKARLYQRPTPFPRLPNMQLAKHRDKPKRDPFANIQSSKGRTVTLTGKAFSQTRPKGETITTSARVSSSKEISTIASTEVPTYTHYTRISANVLGTNTRQLQVWPYFGEDVDDDGSIRERFDVIVEDRPRKVLISQQASTYGPYFLAFLEEIGCPIETILKYLLEAYEGPDGLSSRLSSFATDQRLARKLVRAKEKYCKDDFDRTSQRWVSVASSLPEIDDETLWKAAVVCHAFWIRTNFSPWQLARKYAKFPNNNKIEGLVTFDKVGKYASVACSICQLHDCPFHGTILERPDDSESDDDDVNSIDALDVDYPPRVNFKELATAPLEREPEVTARTQPKKSLNWWMNENNSLTWDHSKRGPFFPCSHVGISCEDARCSCFGAKVCCEKTCGCSKSCSRRFEGCKCAKRSKCCAQDDSCECFRMNRECDPDLCDSCEAHVVLNPVNRYDDNYLLKRCRNVAIQRGVPKRTLLGRSAVHGFGLYAGEPIAKDEFIGEYQGEILTRDETERRGAVYEFQKLSYIFDLNRDQTIDSQRMGNKIRFINHAADSALRNVYPRIMLCNLAHRIGMFAHRNIKIGEELFFNYGGSYHEKLYGEEEQTAHKEKSKGKGKAKAVVSHAHIRPSTKSYQPSPEVTIEAPRRAHDSTYHHTDTDIKTNIHSSDSEDDRPRKRRRRSRLSSPKRQKLPSPKKPRPSLPKESIISRPSLPKESIPKKSSARKTEDRTRVRGINTTNTTPTIDTTIPLNLKPAMNSAHVLKPPNRRGRVVVEESEDDSEEDSDDDMDQPRRSSRPRKVSRKLREEG
jgi:hypothetical protein